MPVGCSGRFAGQNCDDFLPVETREDQELYEECLCDNATVGNNQERKSSTQIFQGGQWDPNVNPPYTGGNNGNGFNLGNPLYSSGEIERTLLFQSPFNGRGLSDAEASFGTSIAGLMKLNEGQAEFDRKDAADPFNSLRYFQVNPDYGNLAQYGGFQQMLPTQSPAPGFLQEMTVAALMNADNRGQKKIVKALKSILQNAEGMYQQGGMAEDDGSGFVPIQTEKGERLIFPDATTSKVKADKKHSGMSDEEVTDIVPEGTYVASATPKMKIPKKVAEEYSLYVQDKPYKLNEKLDQPEEVTLAKYFGKSKRKTPAQLVDAIDKKHPILEEEDGILGPFKQVANSFVIDYRQKLFPQLIDMSETYSQQIKAEEVLDGLTTIAQYASMPTPYKYGGKVMRRGVNQFQDGGGIWEKLGDVAEDLNPIKLIFNIIDRIGARNRRIRSNRRIEEAYDEALPLLEQAIAQRDQFRGMGLATGAVSLLSQDPRRRSYGRSPEFSAMLADLVNREGRTMSDLAIAPRLAASQAMRNVAPLGEAAARTYGMGALGAMQGQYSQAISDAASNTAAQTADRRAALRSSYADRLNQLRTPALQDIYNKMNETTQNQNALLGSLGSLGSQYFNTSANLASQDAATKIALNQWRVASKNNVEQGHAQDVLNLNSMMANAFPDVTLGDFWNPTTNTPTYRGRPDFEPWRNEDWVNPNMGPPIRTSKMGGYPKNKQMGGFLGGMNLGAMKNMTKNQYAPQNPNPMPSMMSMLGGGNMGGGNMGGGNMMGMLSSLLGLKKKYQQGSFVDNPYGEGSELAALWNLFNEKELSPIEIIPYLTGDTDLVEGPDGRQFTQSVFQSLAQGEGSSEYDRIMQELAANRTLAPISNLIQSSYSRGDVPGGRVIAEEPFRQMDEAMEVYNIAENINDPSRMLTFSSGLDPDTYRFTGRVTEKPKIKEKVLNSRKEAEAYLDQEMRKIPFEEDQEIRAQIIELGPDKFLVTETPKIAQILPTLISSNKTRPPEDIAKLVAMGFDPEDENVMIQDEGKKVAVKVSPDLATRILGTPIPTGANAMPPSLQKQVFTLSGNRLYPVSPSSTQYGNILGKAATPDANTRVIERYFQGKDPLLTLTKEIVRKNDKKKKSKK